MRLAIALCCLPLAAIAEDCTDAARDLLAAPLYEGQPYRAQTRTMFGQMETLSTFEWVSHNHHRTIAIKPEGSPDSMYHDGVYYGSDGQGGWVESNRSDPAEVERQAEAFRENLSGNLVAADCSEITDSGSTYTMMTSTITAFPPYESDLSFTYFIDTADNVAALRQTFQMSGQEMLVEQRLEPAPGLQLPVPVP